MSFAFYYCLLSTSSQYDSGLLFFRQPLLLPVIMTVVPLQAEDVCVASARIHGVQILPSSKDGVNRCHIIWPVIL